MKFYLDRWGCEGGLAWGKSLRIGTANQMLRICSHVAEIVPTVTFPFVVMHDPEDPIGTKKRDNSAPQSDILMIRSSSCFCCCCLRWQFYSQELSCCWKKLQVLLVEIQRGPGSCTNCQGRSMNSWPIAGIQSVL
jgi:hypothetical protein